MTVELTMADLAPSHVGRASSVGRAREFWSGGRGFDPGSGRWLGRCQYNVTG